MVEGDPSPRGWRLGGGTRRGQRRRPRLEQLDQVGRQVGGGDEQVDDLVADDHPEAHPSVTHDPGQTHPQIL